MAKTEIVKHKCTACDYNDDAIRVDGHVLCPQCGCPDDPQDGPGVDEDAMAEYIQDRLLQKGIVVTREDILMVLELEDEYFADQGLHRGEPDA